MLKYDYNRNGAVVEQNDISGKTIKYEIDDLSRIQKVFDKERLVASYDYNEDSTINTISYGNGVKTNYSYNDNKNITKLSSIFNDDSVLTDNSYFYDNNGNQIEKTENGKATIYSYDNLNQIEKVIYNREEDDEKVESFYYDDAQNRVKRVIDEIEERYYYDKKNRLTKIQKPKDQINFSYDNEGNTIKETSSKGIKVYNYDIFNRTKEVKTEEGNSLKNIYDPFGLRVEILRDDKEINRFIFSGWNVISELDKDNNVKSREIRGYGLLSKEVDEKDYYYHRNEHGDVTSITDSDENIVNTYSYDIFGNIVSEKEGINNRFKYAGEQFDNETGQYYLRARFYNPTIGRFTQEDVYRGDGLNLYAYVSNNPIMWIDPSGYVKCPPKYKSMKDLEEQLEKISEETQGLRGKSEAEILKAIDEIINPIASDLDAQIRNNTGGEDVTRKKAGPYIAGVYNEYTDKIFVGINDPKGDIPEIQFPTIKERINQLHSGEEPYSIVKDAYSDTHGSGSHAEIYATNKALIAEFTDRYKKKYDISDEVLVTQKLLDNEYDKLGMDISKNYLVVETLKKINNNTLPEVGIIGPRCIHCQFITDGVTVDPEMLIKEAGNIPRLSDFADILNNK